MATSSFSDTGNCVDVTAPDPALGWTKEGVPVAAVVRDTKSFGELWFTATEWDAFLAGVRAGEFDLARLEVRPRGAHAPPASGQ